MQLSIYCPFFADTSVPLQSKVASDDERSMSSSKLPV